MSDLPTFPLQPQGVAWPTSGWEQARPPTEAVDGGLEELLDRLVGPDADPALGHTNAVAIVHRGCIVAERYGERLVEPLAELAGVEPGPIGPEHGLHSWSMAKSVLHLAVGVARGQGLLEVGEPAPVPEWQESGDDRGRITWDDLLTMRSGLAWTEVYEIAEDNDVPDVIRMLYLEGAGDMGAFAAEFPLVSQPGSAAAYCYSSGTSNLVARALQRVIGCEGPAMTSWLKHAIFDPIGARSAAFGYDGAGTWVGSSYVELTARDWLRLGLLVLRGGSWDGVEVITPGWIDHGRTSRSADELWHHGAHWWAGPERPDGLFLAHGFEGQRLMMSPARDLVLFRQGKTPADASVALSEHLLAAIDLFPPGTG